MRSSIGFLMLGLVSIAAGCAAPASEDTDTTSAALRDPPGKPDLHTKPPPKLEPLQPWEPRELVPIPFEPVPEPPVGDFQSISGYAGSPLQSGHANGSSITTFTMPTHIACNSQGTTWVVDEDPSAYGLGYLRLIYDTRGTSFPHVQAPKTLADIGLAPWTIGGIAVDETGSELFLSDSWNNVIFRFGTGYVAGQPLPVVAGGAGPYQSPGFTDGPATSAKFSAPAGIARDASGNLFVADLGNHAVRKISSSGDVTTVASGASIVPSFDPKSIAVAKDGTIYVTSQQAIYRVTSGSITLFAGNPGVSGFSDGLPMSSRLHDPKGLAVDRMGDVYVADSGNHRVRKIVASTTMTTTIGNLPGFDPTRGFFDGYGPDDPVLDIPSGLAFWGDRLMFSDEGRLTVRTMSPAAPNLWTWP